MNSSHKQTHRMEIVLSQSCTCGSCKIDGHTGAMFDSRASWSIFPSRLVACYSALLWLRADLHSTGFFIVKRLKVSGVDAKQWWSNGMSIRALRCVGDKSSSAFLTEKGNTDLSLAGSRHSVFFPGSYTFEGPWCVLCF